MIANSYCQFTVYTFLKATHVLTHLSLPETRREWRYYDLQFTDEENEAERL
jgi:hypothetical protein